MKFYGKARIKLSKSPPEEFLEELTNIVSKLNEETLLRGVKNPEDGARIISFSFKDDVITFEIESGRLIPVHTAALRIKNFLLKILGMHYKIGIRELTLESPKVILNGELRINIDIPIIEEIASSNGQTIITLKPLNESLLQKPIFQRLVDLITEKEQRKQWGGKIEHWQKIKESQRKEIKFRDDPNVILEEIGWISNVAPGQWLFTPPFAHILRKFEEMLIDIILKPLGFMEAIFPKMEPISIGLKTGHLKGTPNQMIFASIPRSYNIEEFEPWQDYVTIYNEANPDFLKSFLESPKYYLCFAQCPPFYEFLSKKIFTEKHLPIKWFDRSGPSFRWEGAGGLRGIERLVEFHRIEIVWLGTPDQVIEIRNKLLERYEYFMDKVLDLEWRWAWVTPWFLVHAGETEEMGDKIDINQPGTIDFEAYLPYKGSRDDNKSWLEIGNISIHGAKYTRAFRVQHASGSVLWTGCSGFGVERWVLAFLSQKGFERDSWTKTVQEYIKDLPSGLEAANYPSPQYLNLKRAIEEKVGIKCE
ncbi:MAG: aminoacyl--tRNA ligase-related protein [Candidatus Korarchaeota archaeon]|nr:hypothetical protein [Thermoproteota archaeon]MCR8487508.1 hypothetical protein [Thermoproteota archaeon]